MRSMTCCQLVCANVAAMTMSQHADRLHDTDAYCVPVTADPARLACFSCSYSTVSMFPGSHGASCINCGNITALFLGHKVEQCQRGSCD